MNLDYADDLPDALIRELEEAARAIGLPLAQLELLGQHAAHAEAFVQHVRSGTHGGFLERVDWGGLELLSRSPWCRGDGSEPASA